ncbi:glycosyltransferase family 4 protein [Thermovibrio sp.]
MRALVVLDERWNSALTDLGIKVGLLLRCKVAFAVLKGYPAHRRLKDAGFPLFFIEDPRRGLPFKPFLSLKRAIESYKPDAVITIRGDEMLFSSLLKGSYNFSLFRIHGSQRGIKNTFLNRLIHERFVDGVILSSKRLLNPVISGLRKIFLPGLVDTEKFYYSEEEAEAFRREIGLSKEKKLIGVVGRLDPVKGHKLLIKALSLLKRRDFFTVIVGKEEGVKVKELKELARKLNVEDNLLFIPEYREDIRGIMSACELAVVPSVGSEVVLRAPLEFMACETPVVSTRVGALPEVISSPFGATVNPEPVELASAIDLFLDKELKELGKVARGVADEKYSLKANAPLVNSFICGRL